MSSSTKSPTESSAAFSPAASASASAPAASAPAASAPAASASTSSIAVVLINIGTPDAPTPRAVRKYLQEFLSDPRLVEIPRWIWWWILRLIILPFRAKKTAAKYATIWTDEGSPLKIFTAKQALLLRGYLGYRGLKVTVEYAMRYNTPRIDDVLERLQQQGYARILILPAYPQYSAATTASALDKVFAYYRRCRTLPELRYIKHFHARPAYIHALKTLILKFWERNGRPEKFILSFHGMPERTRTLGDPYFSECQLTAHLLRNALGWSETQMPLTFQSRFGYAKWLRPYTAATLKELAQTGVKTVQVFCPGFASDCLETLEEIAIEARQIFLNAGGRSFECLPCLNDAPEFIQALADCVEEELWGWN